MTAVTVTLNVGSTSHYRFTPNYVFDDTGKGLEVGSIVSGWTNSAGVSVPTSISVQLDNTFLWDVNISFKLAPPIVFEGLNVGTGGDLVELLTAQGWVSL